MKDRETLNEWLEVLDSQSIECLNSVAEVLFLDQCGAYIEI
jgi:hypothetical protein